MSPTTRCYALAIWLHVLVTTEAIRAEDEAFSSLSQVTHEHASGMAKKPPRPNGYIPKVGDVVQIVTENTEQSYNSFRDGTKGEKGIVVSADDSDDTYEVQLRGGHTFWYKSDWIERLPSSEAEFLKTITKLQARIRSKLARKKKEALETHDFEAPWSGFNGFWFYDEDDEDSLKTQGNIFRLSINNTELAYEGEDKQGLPTNASLVKVQDSRGRDSDWYSGCIFNSAGKRLGSIRVRRSVGQNRDEMRYSYKQSKMRHEGSWWPLDVPTKKLNRSDAEKNNLFAFGATSSNDCPLQFVTIQDDRACRSLAGALDLKFVGSNYYLNAPGGCYQCHGAPDCESEVYFNTFSGTAHDQRRKVCQPANHKAADMANHVAILRETIKNSLAPHLAKSSASTPRGADMHDRPADDDDGACRFCGRRLWLLFQFFFLEITLVHCASLRL